MPLNRLSGVAIEDADDAAHVQIQQALVVDVRARANGGSVPGDVAGVFDRHRAIDVDVDAAALRGGGVVGQGAVADRQGALTKNTAATP